MNIQVSKHTFIGGYDHAVGIRLRNLILKRTRYVNIRKIIEIIRLVGDLAASGGVKDCGTAGRKHGYQSQQGGTSYE
jgi:hypothetical protein